MIHLLPYIQAALAHLQEEDDEGLPAALARQNALYDEALAVPRPVRYTDGTEDILDTPWVEVAAPGWELSRPSLNQLVYDLDVSIVVTGHLEDPRHGTLNKRLQILGAALLDSLLQERAFGDGEVTRVRGTYPINPETGDRALYRGMAVIVFTLGVGEARTP